MTETPTLDRRGFIKGAAALAFAAVSGSIASCSDPGHVGSHETEGMGIFEEVIRPRESNNGIVYLAGTERMLGEKLERALEMPLFMYQLGTRDADSANLCIMTGVIPYDKISKDAGYSNLILPENARLLGEPGTGRQLFTYAPKNKPHEDIVAYRFYRFLIEGMEDSIDYGLSHSDMFSGKIKKIDEDNYKVLVGGDLGQNYNPSDFWTPPEQVNEFISGMKDVDIAIPLGDFVSHDSIDLWVTQYLGLYDSLHGLPVFPAKGNHDQSRGNRGKVNMKSHQGFTNIFGSYGNDDNLTISGDPEDVIDYSFDRGNVHFIVLDSCSNRRYNKGYKKAREFLKRDLEAAHEKNPESINLVFTHHPFPITPGSLLEGSPYKVHAVFSGHTHEYGRHTGPDGTQYVRTGGMGAQLHTKKRQRHHLETHPKKYKNMLREEVERTPIHHATILHYNNGHLDMTVNSVDGKEIDNIRIA